MVAAVIGAVLVLVAAVVVWHRNGVIKKQKDVINNLMVHALASRDGPPLPPAHPEGQPPAWSFDGVLDYAVIDEETPTVATTAFPAVTAAIGQHGAREAEPDSSAHAAANGNVSDNPAAYGVPVAHVSQPSTAPALDPRYSGYEAPGRAASSEMYATPTDAYEDAAYYEQMDAPPTDAAEGGGGSVPSARASNPLTASRCSLPESAAGKRCHSNALAGKPHCARHSCKYAGCLNSTRYTLTMCEVHSDSGGEGSGAGGAGAIYVGGSAPPPTGIAKAGVQLAVPLVANPLYASATEPDADGERSAAAAGYLDVSGHQELSDFVEPDYAEDQMAAASNQPHDHRQSTRSLDPPTYATPPAYFLATATAGATEVALPTAPESAFPPEQLQSYHLATATPAIASNDAGHTSAGLEVPGRGRVQTLWSESGGLCHRPAPSGGTCIAKAIAGTAFCKNHTCPMAKCGASKSGKANVCTSHEKTGYAPAPAASSSTRVHYVEAEAAVVVPEQTYSEPQEFEF